MFGLTFNQIGATLMSQPGKNEPSASNPVTIADPGPLGLAGFALTTFVLSALNAEIIVPNASQNHADS